MEDDVMASQQKALFQMAQLIKNCKRQWLHWKCKCIYHAFDFSTAVNPCFSCLFTYIFLTLPSHITSSMLWSVDHTKLQETQPLNWNSSGSPIFSTLNPCFSCLFTETFLTLSSHIKLSMLWLVVKGPIWPTMNRWRRRNWRHDLSQNRVSLSNHLIRRESYTSSCPTLLKNRFSWSSQGICPR
jgi:hypothetical protein